MSKITGIDNATLIPVGAQIAESYFAVPDTYTKGPRHESRVEALRSAIHDMQRLVDRHNALYAADVGTPRFVPLPERITIDLRWKLTWSHDPGTGTSGGMDLIAERTVYDSIADAQAALDRIAAIEGAS